MVGGRIRLWFEMHVMPLQSFLGTKNSSNTGAIAVENGDLQDLTPVWFG
jgi:hypothetical protein